MDIISTTLLKANNMFNLDYIDLSKDEKQRFDNKYTLIHERMPFIRSLSTDINKTINKGLINLIKNNRECFINQIYIDYVENLICNVSGIKFRDRKRSYRNSFILSKDYDYYRTLTLFISYLNQLLPSYSLNYLMNLIHDNNYNLDLNGSFINLYMSYRSSLDYNKQDDYFYALILRSLLIFFISHNELIDNKDLYNEIIDCLIKDKSLLDYYRMNYENREENIPKDLVKRYNTSNKIIR